MQEKKKKEVKKIPAGTKKEEKQQARLRLPLLTEGDLAQAKRIKPPGDAATWYLDDFFRSAWKEYCEAVESGAGKMHAREGIKCVYR